MRIASIGLAALIAILVTGASPAYAQYWQGKGSWCIMPPPGAGTWDCSYYSQWQCEQTTAAGVPVHRAQPPTGTAAKASNRKRPRSSAIISAAHVIANRDAELI